VIGHAGRAYKAVADWHTGYFFTKFNNVRQVVGGGKNILQAAEERVGAVGHSERITGTVDELCGVGLNTHINRNLSFGEIHGWLVWGAYTDER
jgi:hypothetical protein